MRESRILELRVHGIANSPPAEMLCTDDEEVQKKEGDEQGSFWQIKPTSPEMNSSTPSGNTPKGIDVVTEAYSWGNQARAGGAALAVINRAIVHLLWLLVLPFGLCNLAYWARRDIKGSDEGGKWWAGGDGAALVRIFALLQTLFYMIGLVTVFVYLIGLQCFRPLGKDETGTAIRACAGLPQWLDFLSDMSATGRSALLGLVPIALILLIYVIGLRARGDYLPENAFNDERMSPEEKREEEEEKRTAQQQSHDQEPTKEKPRFTPLVNRPPRPPLMSKATFWLRTRTAQTSERTHLAASFAFVLFLLSADALLDATRKEPGQIIAQPGVTARAPIPFCFFVLSTTLLVLAVAVVYTTGLRGRVSGDRIKRGFATVLVWVSAIAYSAWCVWAIAFAPRLTGEDATYLERDLSGQVVVPTFLAGLGALIAVASLTWGYHMLFKIVSWVLLLIAAVGVIVAELVFKSIKQFQDERAWVSIGVLVAVAVAVVWSYVPLAWKGVKETTRTVGWHGNGSAVALLIAWFSSLVITSLLVLGSYAWLTRDADTPASDEYWRDVDKDPTHYEIKAPEFYERFAGSLVFLLLVLIVFLTVAALSALRRHAAFSVPGLMFSPDVDDEARARDAYLGGARRLVDPKRNRQIDTLTSSDAPGSMIDPEDLMTAKGWRGKDLFNRYAIPWNKYPTLQIKAAGRRRAVFDARRVAGLAHRGESVMRLLAILTACALVPLAIPVFGEWLDALTLPETPGAGSPLPGGPWTALRSASGWALGLLALAAATWVVTNAMTHTERPLGLAWDIICFFPRAGHPFTPPCYSERAVPEMKKRIRDFLRDERKAGHDPYVILSAHSMGATIAVATIFSLHDDEEWLQKKADQDAAHGSEKDHLDPNPRIALLTHGVQLRPYFSRFFPEVFGSRVLGIRGTRGPALFRLDPWSKQVVDEAKQNDAKFRMPEGDDQLTLVTLLGGDFLPGAHVHATPRWRNLWRRTDYLGFPVFNYWSHVQKDGTNTNPIDRGATERRPRSYLWDVATHTDYLSTAQYREARDELAYQLTGKRQPAGGSANRSPRHRHFPARLVFRHRQGDGFG